LTKFKISATEEDFEKADQDQGEFVVPEPGYYVLTLKECNPGFSKDDDGNEDKKRPRLECIYEISGVGMEDEPVGDVNYGNIWDYVSFSQAAGWHRAQFMKAMGIAEGAGDYEGDTEDLVGTKVIARLARERGRSKDDPPRARLRSLIPFEDRDASAAFGDASTNGDGAAPEDEENPPWTQEELEGEELKELGRIAREDFDLNPDDSVVKGTRGANKGKPDLDKTKAKLIEAILAAQDEQDGNDGEGDSEASPF